MKESPPPFSFKVLIFIIRDAQKDSNILQLFFHTWKSNIMLCVWYLLKCITFVAVPQVTHQSLSRVSQTRITKFRRKKSQPKTHSTQFVDFNYNCKFCQTILFIDKKLYYWVGQCIISKLILWSIWNLSKFFYYEKFYTKISPPPFSFATLSWIHAWC